MRPQDVIIKKRDGFALTEEEIDFMIKGYTLNEIPDYQMSSFLMAIYFRGMNIDETYYLTKSMLNSGDSIDFKGIIGNTIDKHSTGGVGDKTTFVVSPILLVISLILLIKDSKTYENLDCSDMDIWDWVCYAMVYAFPLIVLFANMLPHNN